MYTSVLLNNGAPMADILVGGTTYAASTGCFSGWHFDAHNLSSLNYHWGGSPSIW
jgi:hypothetical protein